MSEVTSFGNGTYIPSGTGTAYDGGSVFAYAGSNYDPNWNILNVPFYAGHLTPGDALDGAALYWPPAPKPEPTPGPTPFIPPPHCWYCDVPVPTPGPGPGHEAATPEPGSFYLLAGALFFFALIVLNARRRAKRWQ